MNSPSKKYSRFTASAKRISPLEELAIIIPCAGMANRMKSYGPKCLLNINSEHTILSWQLSLIQKYLPHAEVIIVAGFEYESVLKHTKNNYKVIINQNFENTNVAHSLFLASLATLKSNILVLHGDLVFNAALLKAINQPYSTLFLDKTGKFKKDQVGIIHVNNTVTNLSYSAEDKWIHAAYICQDYVDGFRKILQQDCSYNKFTFEVLNELINKGANFNIVSNPHIRAKDINHIDDLGLIKDIIC